MAFRSISTNSTGAANLSVTKPSGVVSGDYLIAFKVIDNVGDTFTVTGFSHITGSPVSTTIDNQQLAVLVRKADGTEGASFSLDSSNNGIGGVIAFSGIDPTTQLDVTPSVNSSNASNASPWTITATGVTTSTNNCDLVIIAGDDITATGDVTHSTPSGFTNQADLNEGFKNVVVFTGTAGAAGATGNKTFTGTGGAGSGWAVFLLALRVVASSPVITAQPANATVYQGQTANFTITATSSGGTLHYQWKDDGSNVGTDSDSYTTAATVLSDNGAQITCDVSDDNGTTSSNAATLQVIATGVTAWIRA